MNNFPFRIQFERNKQNPRKIIYKSIKKNNFSNFASSNSSSTLPSIKIEDNRKKPFIFKSKLSELKKYQSKKTSDIFNKKKYLTPSLRDNIKNIKNNFLMSKDPKETIYTTSNNNKKNSISQSLIKNSYNILNKNLLYNISNIKNEDHIKDLLNYGNRENLYNYIGNKSNFYQSPFQNYMNKNLTKMIKEKTSNDDDKEYYINNG